MTATKTTGKNGTPLATLKMIRDDYNRRIGKAAHMFGDEVKLAFLAQCVMYLMTVRYEAGRERPMGVYVEMYGDAMDFMGFGDE